MALSVCNERADLLLSSDDPQSLPVTSSKNIREHGSVSPENKMAATMQVLASPGGELYTYEDRSAVWRCPKLYITLRVFKNVAKVANLEAVKIQFRHLLFLSFLSSASLAPLREQYQKRNTHE